MNDIHFHCRFHILSLMIFLPIVYSLCYAQGSVWPDPVSNDVIPYGVSLLTHGPVLGAPSANSMRVWVRTKSPILFRVLYSQVVPLTRESQSVSGATLAEQDNTGFVELKGLQPNTRYYYGIIIEDRLIDTRLDFQDVWPSFHTLSDSTSCPDARNNPKGLFNVCFSIGHCASQQLLPSLEYGDPPSFQTILQEHGEEIMFSILNGDTIYEECRDGTLEGIRANYRSYWIRGRGFSRLRRYIPMLYTYDDHEIGDNLFGSGFPGYSSSRGQPLMRDLGLKAWSEYCDWANFTGPFKGKFYFGKARLKKGSDLLFDPFADFTFLSSDTVSTIHLGIYTRGGTEHHPPQNTGVYGLVEIVDKNHLRITPACTADEDEIPYSIGTHVYFDWKIGNCHFFALDMRGERGPFPKHQLDDPHTYILGEKQRNWLLDGIRNTDAEFIFIISPDPWVIHHTAFHVLLIKEPESMSNPPEKYVTPKGDGFDSYLAEGKMLIEELDRIEKPIVVFSGDTHNAMSIQITDNLWEILAGPLGSSRHPIGTCGNMPLGGRWESLGRQVRVKWAAPSPNNVLYTQNRNTFYAVVQVNNVMKTASPEIPGSQWFAYDAPNVLIRFHDGYTGKLVYVESISLADFQKGWIP